MSKSSRSAINEDRFILSNDEYDKLNENYFKMHKYELSICPLENIEKNFMNIGLEVQFDCLDDFIVVFKIIDRKKFEYARIKYEF